MSENNFDEDKTEDPTEHKLKKAELEGKRINSKELNFLLFLCISFYFVYIFKNDIYYNSINFFIKSFKFDIFSINRDIFFNLICLIKEKILYFLFYLFFPYLVNILILFLFGKIRFNIKNIKFDFKKLNILNGIKKNFSYNIFLEIIKILIKIFFIILTFSFFIYKKIFEILNIFFIDDFYINILYFLKMFVFFCLIGIFSFIPISIIDFYLEYNSYYKNLKMSKHEILEEFKEIEGNPNVKNILNRRIKEKFNILKNSNISKSDVILIDYSENFCIAIKYDKNTMHVPKILRKISNKEIHNIKKIAILNMIPILKNDDITIKLYKYGKSGKYIPEKLYMLVAEVINWSWKMKKWMLSGGKKPIFNKKNL
ncbi:EscU/YscU/HrcU family type III secretion system export apparatus switch protein [Buchnera aphidicola (Ceratovacuna keduensis)]|uniref:EscU/YscU/HrcU family type III secretion system export apparatus switch protein n=1 Tax=Buchnera aphidicola TaxID=9 RepID=UPI0031B847CC